MSSFPDLGAPNPAWRPHLCRKRAAPEVNAGAPVPLPLTLQLVTPLHLSLLYYCLDMLSFTLALFAFNELHPFLHVAVPSWQLLSLLLLQLSSIQLLGL